MHYEFLLAKLFGNLLNVIRGDTLVTDRFLWLKKNLPKTLNNERLLDIGSGSGAFTIAAASMGYDAVGLSWDKKNQIKGIKRAEALELKNKCEFPMGDARELDKFVPENNFNFVLNFENIEHIIDDKKLFLQIYKTLIPGGFLLLTTPYLNYKHISRNDLGPFSSVEDGGHVRRGYTESMLKELCQLTGFQVEKIDYCSGFMSQLITKVMRVLTSIFGLKISWILVLPLRPIALIMELLPVGFKGRCFSICLVAYKPRF